MKTNTNDAVFNTARGYAQCGLNVIPIKRDGTKAPALKELKPYLSRAATEEEHAQWFRKNSRGIGIVAGAVSNNVIVFDFETRAVFEDWIRKARSAGLGIVDVCPIVETGGGGNHLYVCLSGTVPPGKRLALRLADGKEELLIETRGQGHYVVAPGSPADCHESKKPYTLTQGSLCTIPRISDIEFSKMVELCRSFDERPAHRKKPGLNEKFKNNPVVRDYNGRADESELLQAHGYSLVREDETGERYWQKPDSSNPGHHMTSNYQGSGLIHNFSTENAPFEEERSYTKFEAYTLLEHGGDLKKALAAVKDEGYGDQTSSKKTAAKSIIDIAVRHCQLWKDSDGAGYATTQVGEHLENYPLSSRSFRRWLSGAVFKELGMAIRQEQIGESVRILEHMAGEGQEYPVAIRVCGYQDKVYLDLCDNEWRAVEIDAAGWREARNCPVKFIRRQAMSALPQPERGGDLNVVFDMLNLPDEHSRKLWVAYTIGILMPTGPYPILMVTGEQGSGKTTVAKAPKFLIDPSNKAPTRSVPGNEEQLLLWVQSSWVLVIDNLSGVSIWLSDALCRLSSGGGYSKRELYSDGDEFFMSAQRPVILNGIDDLATRGDLADRGIILLLPKIPEDKYIPDAEIWRRLEADRPNILGVLLDAVSCALRKRSTTVVPAKTRMADFALFVSAAEEALGWESGSFMQAYQANRHQSAELGLESSALFKILTDIIGKGGFEGTPTELHELVLDAIRRANRSHDRFLPKTPSNTSSALRRIAPALRKIGWTVEFSRGHERKIEIKQPTSTEVPGDDVDGVEPTQTGTGELP